MMSKIMGYYFCWATLMLKEYENDIVANMIKKGYRIYAADVSNELATGLKNGASYIFVISVSKELKLPKNKTYSDVILNDFKSALADARAKYYSVIVMQEGDSTFAYGNIILPENPGPSRSVMD